MTGFEIKSQSLKELLDLMFEAAHETDKTLTTKDMQNFLEEKGKAQEAQNLLEIRMMLKQNHDVVTMRKNLDVRIAESQLKQLDAEINECLAKLESNDGFSEELYHRYQSLKKEREVLINTDFPE